MSNDNNFHQNYIHKQSLPQKTLYKIQKIKIINKIVFKLNFTLIFIWVILTNNPFNISNIDLCLNLNIISNNIN